MKISVKFQQKKDLTPKYPKRYTFHRSAKKGWNLQ